jgi:uncharacterized membrane protein YedE/YeeE
MMGHGYIFILSYLSFLLAGMMSAFVHTSYLAFFLIEGLEWYVMHACGCIAISVALFLADQLALPFFRIN